MYYTWRYVAQQTCLPPSTRGATMDQMTERPVLYLIDGSAYLYRAFFALPALSTSTGLPTNAVYGFTTMLQKIIREHRPDYLAVVFDEKEPTLRHKAFKEYKAHRPPMPDALSRQIPYIHRVVEAFAIPVIKLAGYEADDLIGTLAAQASSQGLEVVIVTGDKDMFQLLSPTVRIYDPVKDKFLTEEDCLDRFGVEPARVVEVMGLMGDATDNIPGVKGIGEKTAKKLIAEFGTIENLPAHLPEEKGGELRHEERVAVLDDPADRSRLVQAIRDAAEAAIHCDLVGDEPFGAAVRGIGVCAGPGQISYFPGEDGLADLRPVLEDPAVYVYVHDAQAAWLALRRSGVRLTPRFDTMLAGYLLNPNRRSPALETLAQEDLAESLGHAPLEKKPKKGDLFEQPDPGETATRAARAASAIARLRPTLAQKLEAAAMPGLFERVELPLTVVLGEMEAAGFRGDTGVLARLSKELESQLDRILGEIYRKAGTEFNVNSPKQLSEVLFEKLKLPPVKKTKTGYSTDQDVLTQLALQHDLPAR